MDGYKVIGVRVVNDGEKTGLRVWDLGPKRGSNPGLGGYELERDPFLRWQKLPLKQRGRGEGVERDTRTYLCDSRLPTVSVRP